MTLTPEEVKELCPEFEYWGGRMKEALAQARKERDMLKQALEQLEKACGKLCINQNNHSLEVFHEFGNAYNNAVHVLIFNEPEQPV